jgi:moderate conductance mechanosensitive channel
VLLALVLVLLLARGAIAQPTPLPSSIAQLPSFSSPTADPQTPPVNVERRGTIEATGVQLDGKELFKVASPTVLNRSGDLGSQIPVEVRAKQITLNLAQLLVDTDEEDADTLDPASLKVLIETLNDQPVLFVKDATLAEPKVLLTVTDADAQYYSLNKDKLALRWQGILETALREALELRQPEALQRQIKTVLYLALLLVLLTLGLGSLWWVLGRHQHRLEQRQQMQQAALQNQAHEISGEAPTREAASWLLQSLRQHFNVQQRLQVMLFLRWLLFWAIGFTWVLGLAYGLAAFPQTRQFARQVIAIPMVLLLTWFGTSLVNRLANFGIDRIIQNQKQSQLYTEANLQRTTTIANVLKGFKMVLVYTIGLFLALQWLKLAPTSVLALGAIAALMVSFTIQNLIKDLANGFLILLEDQYRIGDNVQIGTITGIVEELNLRMTQVRSDDGNLITLPNSLIMQVENRSRTWARANIVVEVAYQTDVDYALSIIKDTISAMAEEPAWQPLILNPHEMIGVDHLSHTGIMIRIWVRTAPLNQWMVGRELRRRLKIAFDQQGIEIGMPQQVRRDLKSE